MKLILKSFLLLIPAFFSLNAHALSQARGTVSWIETDWNTARLIVSINGATGPCGGNQFTVDTNNPNYKETIALLLTARVNGQTVTVTADGSCPNGRSNLWGVGF